MGRRWFLMAISLVILMSTLWLSSASTSRAQSGQDGTATPNSTNSDTTTIVVNRLKGLTPPFPTAQKQGDSSDVPFSPDPLLITQIKASGIGIGRTGVELSETDPETGCKGYFTSKAPAYAFNLLHPTRFLRVSFDDEFGNAASLLVQMPDQVFYCVPKLSKNVSVEVVGNTTSGTVRIWVGGMRTSFISGTLSLTGKQPGATPTPRTPLQVGSIAVITEEGDELYMLQSPQIGSDRLAVFRSKTLLQLVSGPESADGQTWWQVRTLDGHTGWVAEGTPDTPWINATKRQMYTDGLDALGVSNLFVGARIMMSPNTSASVAIRDQAGSKSSTTLRTISTVQDVINREVLLVVNGPQYVDNLRWWQVRYADKNDPTFSKIGWVAEGQDGKRFFDVLYTGEKASNVRGGHFKVGDTVRVTSSGDGLKIRVNTSRSASAVTTLGQGVNAVIIEGPTKSEGDIWWKIQRSDGKQGWVTVLPGWMELAGAAPKP